MNPFKLNSTIGTVARIAIAESLGISWTEVYKTVKNINCGRNSITTKDGKEYRLVLEEVIEKEKNSFFEFLDRALELDDSTMTMFSRDYYARIGEAYHEGWRDCAEDMDAHQERQQSEQVYPFPEFSEEEKAKARALGNMIEYKVLSGEGGILSEPEGPQQTKDPFDSQGGD